MQMRGLACRPRLLMLASEGTIVGKREGALGLGEGEREREGEREVGKV